MIEDKEKEGARQRADKQIALVKDYKALFGSVIGKRVLADLIDAHYVLRPMFHETNQHITSVREGERNAVLRILSKLAMNPTKMRAYVEEQLNDDRTNY